jgi:hypothetical protein
MLLNTKVKAEIILVKLHLNMMSAADIRKWNNIKKHIIAGTNLCKNEKLLQRLKRNQATTSIRQKYC